MARCVAGAASRLGPVSVLAPGPGGTRISDGLFDVEGLGECDSPGWPAAVPPDALIVVDDTTESVYELLTRVGAHDICYLAPAVVDHLPQWRHLGVDGPPPTISPYVPVNPLAAEHRHHGFGFTGYLLVLAGPPEPGDVDPLPAVSWLGAAFHEADVVVVADAVATAWKGRVVRGRVSVDTRMDLWRLIAHAAVCVDLDPGPLLARECVEALRFGTPIVVPENAGPAGTHARSGGGATFVDPADLIAAVESLQGAARTAASQSGRRYADARFGDPARMVREIETLVV